MQIHPSDHPQEAFERAFEEYKDRIFRHCYFHLYDRERATELTQEAFMKTWEYVAAGNDVDNAQAFLYRVATNLVYNESRHKKTVSLEDLQEAGFDPPSEDENLSRDVIAEEAVLKALSIIEEPYRAAVTLRFVEGFQPKEIADMLGESANTVSVRITRGLKQLRAHMPHG